MPGLLSGTPFFGSRFQVVAKSPKTGGWGDANGGGDFGPWLKNAGWDGILVSGISDKPVYLFIDDDKAELRDASDLWGLDAIETEAKLKERHGKKTSVACIGPAGEKLSLMAGVCNDRGRVAARSGLGAVMGSKKLKAVAVVASRAAILARDKEVQAKVRDALDSFSKPLVDFFHKFGTPGITASSAVSGDSPIKNWGGVGTIDFPQGSELSGAAYAAKMDKPYGCWHCPVACGAESKDSDNPKYPFPRHTHRAEYETMAQLRRAGPQRRPGLADLPEPPLQRLRPRHHRRRRRHRLRRRVLRERRHHEGGHRRHRAALGQHGGDHRDAGEDRQARGLRRHPRRRHPQGGREDRARQRAVRDGDRRRGAADARPQAHARLLHHLQARPDAGASHAVGPQPAPGLERRRRASRTGRRRAAAARSTRSPSEYLHVVNSCGLCFFVTMCGPNDQIHEWINAVTGWDMTLEEVRRVGERIANLRMAFEVREGNNPAQRKLPARLIGDPPMSEGPHAGVTLDVETLRAGVSWKPATGTPRPASRVAPSWTELGLSDVADAIGA